MERRKITLADLQAGEHLAVKINDRTVSGTATDVLLQLWRHDGQDAPFHDWLLRLRADVERTHHAVLPMHDGAAAVVAALLVLGVLTEADGAAVTTPAL